VIDWDGPSTEVLLNPRLPATDAERVRQLIARIPLDGHVWVTTSGSTGRLKPVALSKRAILASAAAVNTHLRSDANDVWLNVLPTFHVGGLGLHARAHLSGAPVVTLDHWDSTAFLRLLTGNDQRLTANRQRPTATVTLTSLVPAHVFDLVQTGLRPPSSLRAVIVGGGALPPDLYARARALGWPLLPSYGATECASQIATAALASLEHDAFPALSLLPHVAARTDAEGRIEIRSDALFTGYAADAGLDDPTVGGWWRSDDLGAVARRTLTVYGRADDTMKVGGELVNLAALETKLAEVLARVAPGTDAALYAAADARLGRVIGLAVAGTDPGAVSRVQEAFNAAVLPFERARVTSMVPAIPRTAMGKVMREELKKQTVEDGRRR
jgi:o-succinylbenzoate---CoA ligase